MNTKAQRRYNIGFVAGTFDILHPGYIQLFSEAKTVCRHLIVALHVDPHKERKEKFPPLFSVQERMDVLLSLKQIEYVFTYKTEKDLYKFLEKNHPDVMFLGYDYKDVPYTGFNLGIPVHFINRDHGWSATKVRKLIMKQMMEAKK